MVPPSTTTILVTGCSTGGIGAALALALALAQAGHIVFATARDPSRIPAVLSSHLNVKVLSLDVTSAESVAAAGTAVRDAGIGLHVLVNNAGAGYTVPILDVDVKKAKAVHDVNFWGPFRVTQAFAGLLVESKGRVVNISSVAGVVNTPWIGVYSSSKAALNNLSDTLRLELSHFGVSVITVLVGTVATPFHANEPDVRLPPASRYAVIRDTISKWATGEAGPKGGSVGELASSLVDDVVGNGAQAQVLRGINSGAVSFVSRWVPAFISDRLMNNGQGLDELSKTLADLEVSI